MAILVTNRQLLQAITDVAVKVDILMTESAAVEAATAQIETDVAAINTAMAAVNTALADLEAKITAGGSVTAADLAALQSAVGDLNSATSGAQATGATAQADDPGPSA